MLGLYISEVTNLKQRFRLFCAAVKDPALACSATR